MANEGPEGKVKHRDAYYFDNIVLMAPSAKNADIQEDLGVDQLLEFFSEPDHNLLVFTDAESKRHVRKLANNLGVDLQQPSYKLRDNSQSEPSNVMSKNLFRALTETSTPVFDRFESNNKGVLFKDGIG